MSRRTLVFAALAGLLAAGCAQAVAQPAAFAPRDGPGVPAMLLHEGGVMRPLSNGARVALQRGWATVTASSVSGSSDIDLDLRLFDGQGHAAAGEVVVEYQSIDMDHGRPSVRAVPLEDLHRARVTFAMPGAWRVLIHVTRGELRDTITLVLPTVGM